MKKISFLTSLVFLGLFILAHAQTAQASTYYVAPNGSDSNSGSSSTPFLTIQKASDTAASGDTVIVRAGNYAGFNRTKSGTASAPVVFKGETGATITSRCSYRDAGINLEGASYIDIEGFYVNNTSKTITHGIRSVNNQGVIIRNNNVNGSAKSNILTGSSENILIENNIVSNSIGEHGIYVSNSADNPIVRGNTSFGNSNAGLQINGDIETATGPATVRDGIVTGALIENNVLYNNNLSTGGGTFNFDGLQNSTIRNNLLYNNHSNAVTFFKEDGGDSSKNNVFVNNTVIQPADAKWVVLIKNGSTGNKFYNNILYSPTWKGSFTISSDSRTGFVSDYNIVTNNFGFDEAAISGGLKTWQSYGYDLHSIIALPTQIFASLLNSDYHLTNISPAIDSGTSLNAPAQDLDGHLRPVNNRYDIGAYEYGSSIFNPPVLPVPPTLTLSSANSDIQLGSSTMLTWSSNYTTSCTANGAWSGTKSLSGSTTVSPTSTSTYTLLCIGDGGSVTNSVTINVRSLSSTSVPSSCLDLHYTETIGITDKKTHGEVSKTQQFLKDKGYFTDDVTGYFGKASAKAVMKLQTDHGVYANGIVNEKTRALIKLITCPITLSPVSVPAPAIAQSSNNNWLADIFTAIKNQVAAVLTAIFGNIFK